MSQWHMKHGDIKQALLSRANAPNILGSIKTLTSLPSRLLAWKLAFHGMTPDCQSYMAIPWIAAKPAFRFP